MAHRHNPVASLLRSNYCRQRKLPPEIFEATEIRNALDSIRRRWPIDDTGNSDDEAPIFILSAGWGSGSTLLQRLVVSAGNCLIWGEPLDQAAPIQRLARSIVPISDSWPRPQSFEYPDESTDLHSQWIANLTPDIENLRQAHRNFFIAWLKAPAVERGFQYWGLKEVRLTIFHAEYLQWLFPNARFLFIYRDLLKSFRSCKNVNWISIWPGYKVKDVLYFSLHWETLLSGYLRDAGRVNGRLVQYEELASGAIDVGEIDDFLQIGTLDRSVLERKVGARSANRPKVSFWERKVINGVAAQLRDQLGYS